MKSVIAFQKGITLITAHKSQLFDSISIDDFFESTDNSSLIFFAIVMLELLSQQQKIIKE